MGGFAACARSSAAPTGIALVNADSGPTGERVVQAVQEVGEYEWTVLAAGEADVDDYAAVITLPADLTESMGTLAGPQPRRAQVTVATHAGADGELVDGAISTVTQRIGAVGVEAALSATAAARTEMTSVQFSAQLLNAGVNAAAAGADQFSMRRRSAARVPGYGQERLRAVDLGDRAVEQHCRRGGRASRTARSRTRFDEPDHRPGAAVGEHHELGPRSNPAAAARPAVHAATRRWPM